MKILHTADLHLGQVIYQNYDRIDEHKHYFEQLEKWCADYAPDVLLVSGDVFDIQQPSAAVKEFFTTQFVSIATRFPQMHVVITAGNHDSASRLRADEAVWKCIRVHIVGNVPTETLLESGEKDWQKRFVIELPTGYVVAFPYMVGNRKELVQAVLDYVEEKNTQNLPVVMMAHAALSSADVTGHGEIGNMVTQSVADFGTGYDYLALGHIHRPQTLGFPIADENNAETTYPSPVARYSGSALHVSCDERYPHTVSLLEIDAHGGEVKLNRLRINELRHFYELPETEPAHSVEEALIAVKDFKETRKSGYFRLHVDYKAVLPADFDQKIYAVLESSNEEIRYNPKIVWSGAPTETIAKTKEVFQVAELQEMTNPLEFIEKTKDHYPDLNIDDVREAFKAVEEQVRKMRDKK